MFSPLRPPHLLSFVLPSYFCTKPCGLDPLPTILLKARLNPLPGTVTNAAVSRTPGIAQDDLKQRRVNTHLNGNEGRNIRCNEPKKVSTDERFYVLPIAQ